VFIGKKQQTLTLDYGNSYKSLTAEVGFPGLIILRLICLVVENVTDFFFFVRVLTDLHYELVQAVCYVGQEETELPAQRRRRTS